MMSGGEQQRVAIARALAAGGRILLADEPTGNLDAANGEAVVAILKKLAHEKDYIVVVITHNTSIAEQADVVYRIVDGRLSADAAE
jgi:ABC-type lipoprotein export system ATPase subunit